MLCDFRLIKKLFLIEKFGRVKAVKLKVSGVSAAASFNSGQFNRKRN
jgi:hypothetical protein